MKYPCEERTYEYFLHQYKIRLWYNADKVRGMELPMVAIPHSMIKSENMEQIADFLAENIKELNAVQVISMITGEGFMNYTVPFEEKEV